MNQRLDPENIIANAEQLIERVQAQLQEGAQFFENQGLDRDKSQRYLESLLGAKEREDLEQLVRDDQAAIEQEVHEEMARLGLSPQGTPKPPSSGGGARMRRNMI